MAERRKRARSFGTARRLPSGRWQVRYYDQAGVRHTAPRTFPSRADANRYLAQVQADCSEGPGPIHGWLGSPSVSGWSAGGRPRPICGRGRELSTTTCCDGFCDRRSKRRRWSGLTR